MNTLNLKQIELANLIPNFNIQEIENIISFAKNNQSKLKTMKRKSLVGIWSEKKLDKIDVENEIKELRNNVFKNLDEVSI